MASKLTFEAKMDGLEKVLEILSKTNQELSGLGKTGDQAFESMEKRLKNFHSSLEYLNKQQTGLGGLSKMFDDISAKGYKIVAETRGRILEQYKKEVGDFESVAKKAEEKIDQLQKRIDVIKQKRAEDRTREETADLSFYQKNLDREQQIYLSSAAAKARGQAEIWQQSSFFREGAQKFLGNFGGIGSQIASATNAQAFNAAPFVFGGLASAIRGGLEITAAGGRAVVYDRSIQPVREYLAQRNLEMMTAGAREGDITTAYLRRYGMGIEAQEGDSFATKTQAFAESALSSRGVQGALHGLGGIATAAALPKLAAMIGLTMGPIGLMGLGIVGAGFGLYGALRATPESTEQRLSALRSQYASMDKETYDLLIGQAGRNFTEESQLTRTQQRMFGVSASHENISALLQQGVADLKDLAGFIHELNKFGKTLKYAEAGVFGERFGMTSPIARAEYARSIAAKDELKAMFDAKSLAARAGFYDPNTMQGREVLTQYAAELTSQRGFGATDISQTGAVAARIAAGGGALPAIEAAQAGVAVASTLRNLSQSSGTLSNLLERSALTKLGITNPIVQDFFIKKGLHNQDVKEQLFRIAERSGIKRSDAAKILGDVGAAISGAFGQITGITPGSEAFMQMAMGGGEASTFALTGDVKTSENMFTMGKMATTAIEQAYADMPGGPSAADVEKVQIGKGQADIQSGLRAKEAATIEQQMEIIAKNAGKSVSDTLQQVVVDGFRMAADKIIEAGNKASASQVVPTGSAVSGEKYLKTVTETGTRPFQGVGAAKKFDY